MLTSPKEREAGDLYWILWNRMTILQDQLEKGNISDANREELQATILKLARLREEGTSGS